MELRRRIACNPAVPGGSFTPSANAPSPKTTLPRGRSVPVPQADRDGSVQVPTPPSGARSRISAQPEPSGVPAGRPGLSSPERSSYSCPHALHPSGSRAGRISARKPASPTRSASRASIAARPLPINRHTRAGGNSSLPSVRTACGGLRPRATPAVTGARREAPTPALGTLHPAIVEREAVHLRQVRCR